MKSIRLTERHVPGKRLGRHVHHDPRSWGHPAAMAPRIISVMHKRLVPVFDQGSLGSCCGNAAVGCISTAPFAHQGTENEAVDVYSAATKIDDVSGVYPPDDTGSSGIAVMKVLKARGLIKGYSHTFSLDSALRALVLRPGITGLSWREGCDSPDASGEVVYDGEIRGGHEIELAGIDASARRASERLVWFWNSWGASWGAGGMFSMSWGDYEAALADHGDATFPLAA